MKRKIVSLTIVVGIMVTLIGVNPIATFASEEKRATYNLHKSALDWDIGDMGMEDPGTITPETGDKHVSYNFKLDFPTGAWKGGGGEIRLQNHYFNPDIGYGWPPTASVEMYSDVVADFEADLVAVDDWNNHFGLCSGSYQSYNYYDSVKLRTCNSLWSHIYGTFGAWDNVGQASVYDVYIDD